jgi:glyoxalase family protein
MQTVNGLHHITAISGDAQENLHFYSHVLGMRLVKKSVNQDDPTTYHLFYADGAGSPGSDITFFPWKDMPRVRKGVGLTDEVLFAVPPGSLAYWQDRLGSFGVDTDAITTRFGERTLPFRDVHGMAVALVETDDLSGFTAWRDSPVPQDKQIVRLHGARVLERELAATASFLAEQLGFEQLAEEDGWRRYALRDDSGALGGSGRLLDIRELPGAQRGQWGVGGVHHLAWRVRDTEQQLAVRAQVAHAGRRPTEVIDRFWFKSVYFMEPGGVLFELATDGPGFAVDEHPDVLGTRLILPPWLEPHRVQIEAALPALKTLERQSALSD